MAGCWLPRQNGNAKGFRGAIFSDTSLMVGSGGAMITDTPINYRAVLDLSLKSLGAKIDVERKWEIVVCSIVRGIVNSRPLRKLRREFSAHKLLHDAEVCSRSVGSYTTLRRARQSVTLYTTWRRARLSVGPLTVIYERRREKYLGFLSGADPATKLIETNKRHTPMSIRWTADRRRTDVRRTSVGRASGGRLLDVRRSQGSTYHP